MHRDQRAHHNWSLLYAQNEALRAKAPLCVVFCLVSNFLGATLRAYDFMLHGLEQVEEELKKLSIPFFLLKGNPQEEIPKFVSKQNGGLLVTDFSPLRLVRVWTSRVAKKIKIPCVEVDAHNIIPCWQASDKLEFAARTLRPKIAKQLPHYLTPFPKLKKHPHPWNAFPNNKWEQVRTILTIDTSVKPLTWLMSGEAAAQKQLQIFLSQRLKRYSHEHNNPNQHALSDLSPYLHFGQISAQHVALEVKTKGSHSENELAFLEELIIRKELSDNFVLYNPHYDSPKGFPEWAKKTLKKHARDKRPYLYTKEELEMAKTHDPLWNAAQQEMVIKGKMHGYLRMYWAKKILEWTPTVDQAMKIAIYLNDKYELDGRDPNGYVGIAWSLGGVHDRPWGERSIFGTIRTMTDKGCHSKFNTQAYIEGVSNTSSS
jgi:deoxyribodipyrimidine photo-lyase